MRAILLIILLNCFGNDASSQVVYTNYARYEDGLAVNIYTEINPTDDYILINTNNTFYKPVEKKINSGITNQASFYLPANTQKYTVHQVLDGDTVFLSEHIIDQQEVGKQIQFATLSYQINNSGLKVLADNFISKHLDSIIVTFSAQLDKTNSLRIETSPRTKPNQILTLFEGNTAPVVQDYYNIKIPVHQIATGNHYIYINLLKENKVIDRVRIPMQRVQSKNYTEATYTLVNNSVVKVSDSLAAITWINKYSWSQLERNALAMTPILERMESAIVDKLIQTKNDSLMRQFMINFWQERNPVSPEAAWTEYAKQLNYVARTWGNSGLSGYATDRGRIYLRYGEPAQIEKVLNERDALPYEIWIYPQLKGYNDVYFIFFQTQRAAADFQLLHCNLPGERFTQQWQSVIFRDPTDDNHRIYEWINKGGR